MLRMMAMLIFLAAVGMICRRIWGTGLSGLLSSKAGERRITVERAQLLVVTLLIAGRYVMSMIFARGESVPPLGTVWLVLFGASCGVYLAMKAVRTFRTVSS
jgi:hypothetical protein